MRPRGLVLSLLLVPSCKPAEPPHVEACSPLPVSSTGCVVHGPAHSCPASYYESPPPWRLPEGGVIVMPVDCCWVDTSGDYPTQMSCIEVNGRYENYGYGYK